MQTTRGARPIRHSTIAAHYRDHVYRDVSLSEYANCWREWLQYSDHNSINGLNKFDYVDYTQGTSQTFDHFVLKHADKNILVLRGDFQYHACISKFSQFTYVNNVEDLTKVALGRGMAALIISVPFSDLGKKHPEFYSIMQYCEIMEIPVCLDLAYWGISTHTHLNLGGFSCVKEITCSLSKPFFALENHRVGVRFTREYADDGVSMLNEVNMQNKYSMSLGVHFMRGFGPDWNWATFGEQYVQVCEKQKLTETHTVIFALGNQQQHSEYNRGIPDNYRVCISEFLGDI